MSLDNWTLVDSSVANDDLQDLQYKELKDSGHESFAPNASQANRVFMVGWDFRSDFIDDLIGWSYLDSNNKIHRTLPDEHPEISNFFAMDAQVEGMGVLGKADSGNISWTNAKVTTNYKPRTYNVLSDSEVAPFNTTGDNAELHRYTTRNYTFNIDYLTVNGAMLFVTPTGSPPVKRTLPNPPGKAIGTIGLQYVWTEVPALSSNQFTPPNMTAIKNCFGKVNSAVFDKGGGNYPAGTILFVGVDPKMQTPKLTDDVFYWEITFSFLYRDNGFNSTYNEEAGHNYLFRPELGWDLVTVDGTTSGLRIYQSADLNTLWNLG